MNDAAAQSVTPSQGCSPEFIPVSGGGRIQINNIGASVMRKLVPLIVAILFALGLANSSYGQVPSLVRVNLGIGGGLTAPVGDFGNSYKRGFNVGAKLRISGVLPFRFVGTAQYIGVKSEPISLGTILLRAEETDRIIQVGAGFEYPLVPAPIVKPYVGGDVLYNNIDLGAGNNSRFGFGGGAGVEINLGGVLHLDWMIKYQVLNVVGKEGSEETLNQVSATVSLMLNLL